MQLHLQSRVSRSVFMASFIAALSALASGQAAAASDVSAQPAAAYGKIAKMPTTRTIEITPQTRHMIGAPEFGLMRRRPLLINTARGGLVDEESVGPALDAGHISGAAFDVVTVEPPPLDHPFMKLLDRPNFILTPHVAWASEDAVRDLSCQLADNVEAYVRGTPVNVVAA